MDDDQAAVATVVLEAPAFTTASRAQLLHDVRTASEDDRVRALLLVGSGSLFCVGQDLAEHASALTADPGSAVDSLVSEYAPIVQALADVPKPVVVAVTGVCAGGGIGLALAGDIILASTTARFVTAFAGIGLAPDCGVSGALSFAIGGARALRLLLQGGSFTAHEALEWGMLAEVLEPNDLLRRAHAVADELATGATLAMGTTRRLVRQAYGRPLTEVLDAEYDVQRRLAVTNDHANAVSAFLARRPPAFEGR